MALAAPPPGDLRRRLRHRPGRIAGTLARPVFGLLMVVDVLLGGLAGYAVWHARLTVASGWAAAVAAGLAFPVVLMAAAWLARRRRVASRALWWVVLLAVGNGAGLITVPVTSAWQAGMVAITLPTAAVFGVYSGWHAFAPRAAGFEVCLGIVARDRDEWHATLIRGDVTEASSAATLTQAVGAVRARVAELRPRRLLMTGLQLVILPWTGADYDTWYRVSGAPGRLTAARGRHRVTGGTVEDLVAAIESTPGIDLPRTALCWPAGPSRKPAGAG